jgi:HEAT repeat protein
MSRRVLAACAACAALSLGIAHALTLPDSDVADLLSGVDFVPGKPALEGVLDDPNPDLIALAADTEMDPGLRIRSIRALALYPGPATRATILGVLTDYGDSADGIETLLVRAALYTLATIDGPAAVGPLTPFLDHPGRDVRADAALALGSTGSPAAAPFLSERKANESSQQVVWAINEALRSLSQ